MTAVLLVVIYIAFIGLGIPDSLFGAAWPAIYTEMNIPVSWANFVTIIISAGTIVSSLFSVKLINYLGTAKITAVSTTITAVALYGFSCSKNIIWMCIFSVPLGLGAGAIDTALNNYVALHYKAVHMNFLHCFYGIGVSLSPFLMSLALSDNSWRSGYKTVFLFQLCIAILTIISIPLWKKVQHSSETINTENGRTVVFSKLLKNKKVRMSCMSFFGSCGLEYTCGVWGSTFLVISRGVPADIAAFLITFYYVGMALGRFLSGILSISINSTRIIKLGQAITLAAIIIIVLPFPAYVSGIALFMIGLGNGPVFPNMLHLTPENFGKDISQSVMGVQMAAAYFGIMLSPALFGLISQNISASLFLYYLLIMFAIMVIGGSYSLNRKKCKDSNF